MNKYIYPLLVAQFLSVFADNTILFTVIELVRKTENAPGWYVPALQSVFIVAFVVLAPWVGGYADKYPKSRILLVANLIKAGGAALFLFSIEPLVAYCVVGVGAALYSPAKYGILPELAGHDVLVKANSWIEGSTIFAMLTGMLVGAKVADYSTDTAFIGSVVLLLISAIATLVLPATLSTKPPSGAKLIVFYHEIRSFFTHPRSRFAVLGGALFWSTAACVRVILIAWAPLVLLTRSTSEISELTMFLAVGIVVGAALVPHMIPLEHLRRIRFAACAMGLLIIGLGLCDTVWEARSVLVLMGAAGGMFIVPINAAMQEIGKHTIGSGSAVALQNFFQNFAMLVMVGLYAFAAFLKVGPVAALIALGCWLIVAISVLMLSIPHRPVKAANPE